MGHPCREHWSDVESMPDFGKIIFKSSSPRPIKEFLLEKLRLSPSALSRLNSEDQRIVEVLLSILKMLIVYSEESRVEALELAKSLEEEFAHIDFYDFKFPKH